MGLDVTSSTAGAAVGLRQAQGQFDFGVKALNQNAQQQEAAIATLLQGDSSGGGNVTPTRGQNLNITV
ncbi:hypothetical protein [Azospirillum doebereinerae]|uniref:Motility protein n=1 Tax=Azospirillum doebereinerae TaxID=92933 RepID=A0A433JDA4_9PROT|nr:hypothetical protein [Azospirillum doebereinerae]MCG5238507.1 hypothetical protein [Azospirillum doebereinerae]RUQ74585.1 hypothetical protein EJ913_05970 [Azospirillum doebereinerae]